MMSAKRMDLTFHQNARHRPLPFPRPCGPSRARFSAFSPVDPASISPFGLFRAHLGLPISRYLLRYVGSPPPSLPGTRGLPPFFAGFEAGPSLLIVLPASAFVLEPFPKSTRVFSSNCSLCRHEAFRKGVPFFALPKMLGGSYFGFRFACFTLSLRLPDAVQGRFLLFLSDFFQDANRLPLFHIPAKGRRIPHSALHTTPFLVSFV